MPALVSRAAITIDPHNVGATNILPAYNNTDPWQPGGAYLIVGYQGDAEILVNGSSSVVAPNTQVSVWQLGGFSRVTVDGPGASWRDWVETYNSFTLGGFGDAQFKVLNGALLDTAAGTIVGQSGFNGNVGHVVMTVSGAGSLWNGREGDIGISANTGSEAELRVLDRGEVRARSLVIGGGSGRALAEVRGAGSKITLFAPGAGSAVQVVSGGDSGLRILEGGLVTNTLGLIGQFGDTPAASAVVDGAGSLWSMSNDLLTGYDGDGTLTVSHGGAVRSRRGQLGTRTSVFSFTEPSPGVVTVDGIGSSWTMTQGLSIGFNDRGDMSVKNGAVVTTSSVELGLVINAPGKLTIDGVGSRLTATGPLNVGSRGTGEVGVFNGGVLESGSGRISNRIVEVVGVGSIWRGGRKDIGVAGTLSVHSGGEVITTPGSIIDNRGLVTGDGTLTGTISNSGTVQPGNSPGTLTINGNYLESALGKLEIELGSSAHDLLDVGGSAALAGRLHVSILDEGAGTLLPESGDLFEILHADVSRIGTFSTAALPPLPSDLEWRILYGANAVSLLVVPEPSSWLIAIWLASALCASRIARRSE